MRYFLLQTVLAAALAGRAPAGQLLASAEPPCPVSIKQMFEGSDEGVDVPTLAHMSKEQEKMLASSGELVEAFEEFKQSVLAVSHAQAKYDAAVGNREKSAAAFAETNETFEEDPSDGKVAEQLGDIAKRLVADSQDLAGAKAELEQAKRDQNSKISTYRAAMASFEGAAEDFADANSIADPTQKEEEPQEQPQEEPQEQRPPQAGMMQRPPDAFHSAAGVPVPQQPTLEQQVIALVNSVATNNRVAEANAVGGCFRTVESRINGQSFPIGRAPIDEVRQQTQFALGNRYPAWADFMAKMLAIVEDYRLKGLIVTYPQHAQLLGEIASILARIR